MTESIPEGYAFISGRSRENVREALKRTRDAGLDETLVKVTSSGYYYPVPEGEEGGAKPFGPDDSWKNSDIADYAEKNGIDLGGATKKADMLEAIASSTATADETDSSDAPEKE